MGDYCLKDVNEVHYQADDHNVTATDLAMGLELYAQYGAKDKQSRGCLNKKNTLERAATFWKLNVRNRASADFEKTLYMMISCGKYYLAMS